MRLEVFEPRAGVAEPRATCQSKRLEHAEPRDELGGGTRPLPNLPSRLFVESELVGGKRAQVRPDLRARRDDGAARPLDLLQRFSDAIYHDVSLGAFIGRRIRRHAVSSHICE